MAKKSKAGTAAYIWAVARISLGWIFLWAFLDKMFGLGFATCRDAEGVIERGCDAAMMNGGSPTFGFLKFGTSNSPMADTFQSMAGATPTSITVWDWLFMLGLLGIGVALILGVAMKVAAYSTVLLMAFMYVAVGQPEHNPIVDDHWMYALVALGLAFTSEPQVWGLGATWKKTALAKKYPWLG